MKVLMLSALGVAGAVGNELQAAAVEAMEARGWTVELVDVPSLEIRPCVGCGSCSFKHPGVCVYDDDLAPVIGRIPRSDLLVLAAPERLGTWRPELKAAIDRFLPLIVPRYTRRHGELHHKARYPRPTHILGIGLLSGPPQRPEASIPFLVQRHARNFDIEHHAAVAATTADEVIAGLSQALDRLEAA